MSVLTDKEIEYIRKNGVSTSTAWGQLPNLLDTIDALRLELNKVLQPVCKETGEPSVNGNCVIHWGDACLIIHEWHRIREQIATAVGQAELNLLERFRNAIAQAISDPVFIIDDVDLAVMRAFATAERQARLEALKWTLESGDDEIQAEISTLTGTLSEGK